MGISDWTKAKVATWRLVSTALLIWIGLARAATAHEVFPSVADLSAEDGIATIEMRINLEAILAGVDLDGLEDTDAAENAAGYDALHALEPAALEERLRAAWPEIAGNITMTSGGADLEPRLEAVEIPEVTDPEATRLSMMTIAADLPEGAQSISVGWVREYGTLVLRQQGVENPATETLTGGQISPPIAFEGGGASSGGATFLEYIWVGFEHIIPLGLDHILFVLGLFFLAARIRPLIWQVTAFTLAHTITLAMAALGIVTVSPAIVEPLIAASIVYVAVENIFARTLTPWRPAIIFGFGLLHGLGFASVLGEFGLPEGAFIPALIGFNVGVEIGQLVVIAVAFAISVPALRASRIAGMETGIVAGYIAFAFLCCAGLVIGAGAMPEFMQIYVLPFLLPLAVLGFLCATCVAAASVGTEAYRQFVSIPASAAIALVGIWWVIERTLL